MYLNAWLDAKAARAKHAALEQKKVAQQREQRLRDQYEIWWHREVTKLRNTVSPEELAALEEDVSEVLVYYFQWAGKRLECGILTY